MAAATTGSADVDSAEYAVERARGATPALADVSETMLWTLHNRATETKRHDGVLVDPESARVHEMIDYEFTRRFGEPAGSLAARAASIDKTLQLWLERHPDGIVVSLGEKCGLSSKFDVLADAPGNQSKRHRKDPRKFNKQLYEARHLIENFFCWVKQFRAIATRYDKTARNFLAAFNLIAVPCWLD